MKFLKLPLFTFSVIVTGFCGLLIFSNPTVSEYEEFAIDELTRYLKKEGCNNLSSDLLSLKNPCESFLKLLIDTSKIELQKLIYQKTKSQNFILFTIYSTTLELPAPLPSYEVQTLGVLKNFYIYDSQELYLKEYLDQ